MAAVTGRLLEGEASSSVVAENDGPFLHSPFVRIAECHPGLPAILVEGAQAITYGQLHARTNQLARQLRKLGVGPEIRVGIALRPGPDMATAMLGVLKAGGLYLPLDPTAPLDRSRLILEDAGTSVLIGESASPLGAGAVSYRFLSLDEKELASFSKEALPDIGLDPRNLAYVIYTSGSTGRPKGVMVPHESIAAVFRWRLQAFPFSPVDRVLQTLSFTFDASLFQFFHAWGSGAALVFLTSEERRDPNRIVEKVRAFGISVLGVPPSVWKLLLDQPDIEKCWTLRICFCGGEPLPESTRCRFFDRLHIPLHNVYGPTEASMEATSWTANHENRDEPVSIGRAIEGARTYVLDEALEEAPEGFEGELFIGGVGVARGYLNDPVKTAGAFLPDPFGSPGSRMYRTGDRVRKLSGGCLDFCGRNDEQVKLHGQRIELGEIGAALDALPAVRESAVFLLKERLVAYIVPREKREDAVSEIQAQLRERLPVYMVPVIVILDSLPRNVNGKVDRDALPEAFGEIVCEPFDGDEGRPVEQFLRQLWSETLGTAKFSNEDNFFDLGGNSIQVAILIHKLQTRLGEFVYTVALYDAPTIAKLSGYLRANYSRAIVKLFGPEAMDGVAIAEPIAAVDEEGVRAFQELVRTLPPRAAARSGESKNPSAIFVLSPPRSGSTLLRVMLGGNPRLFSPPELQLLNYNTLAERKATLDTDRDRFWLEGTIRAIMEIRHCTSGEAEQLMAEAEAEGLSVKAFYRRLQEWLGDSIFTEKTPTYPLDPATLRRAEEDFENAKYIHLVRHPCPMISSFEEAKLQVFFPPFLKGPHHLTVHEMAELIWTVCHRNILAFLETVPAARQHRVQFEHLVTDPETETRRIAGFLEVPYHPAMANPYRQAKGDRMTDALHPLARMLGDVKFHAHGRVRPEAAERRQGRFPEEKLGAPTRQLAEQLGYTLATPGKRRTRALFPLHGEGSRPPIFFVHAAGGAIACYRELAKQLGEDQPFYAFRSPILDEGASPAGRTLEEMAGWYLEEMRAVQPLGPYRLGGWSLGGLIAMEMAMQLRAAGEQIAGLVLIDSHLLDAAPGDLRPEMRDFLVDFAQEYGLPMTAGDFAMRRRDIVMRRREFAVRRKDRVERAFNLAKEAGVVPQNVSLSEFRRIFRRHAIVFRTNVRAARRYKPVGAPPEFLLLLAEDATSVMAGPVRDWNTVAPRLVSHTVPGNHFTLLQQPHVEGLARLISDYFAGRAAPACLAQISENIPDWKKLSGSWKLPR